MPRRRKGALTIQEKKFVKELAKTGEPTQAALVTTGSTTVQSAQAAASQMLSRSIVRNALDAELERIYPTHAQDGALVLQKMASKALGEEATMADMERFLKMLAMLKGYQAPKQTESKKLTANVKDLARLPWEPK